MTRGGRCLILLLLVVSLVISAQAGETRELGGITRMATAIRRFRARSENCVLVACGDVFTRGPWHTCFFGEPEIEAMDLMGYDMLVVGNNELKPIWGEIASQDMMLSLMRRSRFPWLSANLTLGDGPPPAVSGLAGPAPARMSPASADSGRAAEWLRPALRCQVRFSPEKPATEGERGRLAGPHRGLTESAGGPRSG